MIKRPIRILAVSAIFVFATAAIVMGIVAAGDSASGHGTLFVTNPDGNNIRRQFSFSARRAADGSVRGNAVLHNPAFEGENGQNYQLQINISCMNVYGNIVFFGGTTRRTNDPNLVDAVFFSVQDNGEPGGGRDKISQAFFWDDDPTTTGDPMACLNNSPGDFPMDTIEAGNISVR